MLESLFDLPLLVAGPAIIGCLCLYALLGMWVVRRWISPRLGIESGDSEFSGVMLQCIMVFYGLALALIAVTVWQNYSDVGKVSSQEATAAAALYRDLGSYPEPARSQLQEQLRNYVDQIIHQAWPMQQRGEIPTAGVELISRFQAALMSYEPATEGQKILHREALSVYNQLIQARRQRLDAVQVRLPGVLWFIIIGGAFISLSSSFFFQIENALLQGIQVILLSAFVGSVIFLIFAFDRPYRGELGLGPDSYQLVYEHLMKP